MRGEGGGLGRWGEGGGGRGRRASTVQLSPRYKKVTQTGGRQERSSKQIKKTEIKKNEKKKKKKKKKEKRGGRKEKRT